MIGVLALQGAFAEHLTKLAAIGVEAREVRTPADLEGCDGLIIPGGESTAIALIAHRTGMWDALAAWVAASRPTWGTCAGMVLLADRVSGAARGGQAVLGGLDIEVHRNFFGSQLASFEAPIQVASAMVTTGTPRPCGVFIRAPAVLACGPLAQPLAWVVQGPVPSAPAPAVPSAPPSGPDTRTTPGSSGSPGEGRRIIVAVRQANLLATAFHPELVQRDASWHELFVRMVEESTHHPLPRRGGAPLPQDVAPPHNHAATAAAAQ